MTSCRLIYSHDDGNDDSDDAPFWVTAPAAMTSIDPNPNDSRAFENSNNNNNNNSHRNVTTAGGTITIATTTATTVMPPPPFRTILSPPTVPYYDNDDEYDEDGTEQAPPQQQQQQQPSSVRSLEFSHGDEEEKLEDSVLTRMEEQLGVVDVAVVVVPPPPQDTIGATADSTMAMFVPNHPRSPTWDGTINWSKSKRTSRKNSSSVSSSGSSCGSFSSSGGDSDSAISASTQFLLSNIQRVPSYDGSTSSHSTLSDDDADPDAMLIPEHHPPPTDPLFFSPRRRINSLVYTTTNHAHDAMANDAPRDTVMAIEGEEDADYPVVGTRMDHGDVTMMDHDTTAATSTSATAISLRRFSIRLRNWRSVCWSSSPVPPRSMLFQHHHQLLPPPPPLVQQQQRRNLLFLFVIAVYTTFGLASPHLQPQPPPLPQQPPSLSLLYTENDRNIVELVHPLDDRMIPMVVAEPSSITATTTTTTPENDTVDQITLDQPSLLRGSMLQGQDRKLVRHNLSFARGGGLHHPPFLYRKKEMNDFLHQPAVEENHESILYSWYMNCIVLVCIVIWWSLQQKQQGITTTTTREQQQPRTTTPTTISPIQLFHHHHPQHHHHHHRMS
jgi:hypothetical protein